MSVLSFSVNVDRLVEVDVMVVSLDAVQAAGVAGLASVPRLWCRGVIDTGANTTSLSPSVVARLGLVPKAQNTTTAAGGTIPVGMSAVSLAIADRAQPSLPALSVHQLTAIDHAIDVDVLVGMDVLLQCKVTLDGPARTLTLEF